MNENTIKIFVYGTLMRGERAHYMIEKGNFLGKYILADYAMYNLGAFPGIVSSDGDSVIGEVYEISEMMLPKMDRYEGEGSLYLRKTVEVTNSTDSHKVYVYIYNHSVEGEKKMSGVWNENNDDYVWYAAYGSNLNKERFLNYIEGGVYALTGKYCEGCSDKSIWKKDCIRTYNGSIYFAKNSGSWEDKGVAFYDPNAQGYTYMRLYLITREQLHEVQGHEGGWYDKLLKLDVVDDYEVYTITSARRYSDVAPCNKYLNLIEKSLVQLLGVSEFEVDNYLASTNEEIDTMMREKWAAHNVERQSEKMTMYQSEIFAQNCPPVRAFRIVVEKITEGGRNSVIVKKVYMDGEVGADSEVIMMEEKWNNW